MEGTVVQAYFQIHYRITCQNTTVCRFANTLFNCWDIGAMLGSISAGLLTTFLPFQMILLLAAFINVPTVPAIKAMKDVKTESEKEKRR